MRLYKCTEPIVNVGIYPDFSQLEEMLLHKTICVCEQLIEQAHSKSQREGERQTLFITSMGFFPWAPPYNNSCNGPHRIIIQSTIICIYMQLMKDWQLVVLPTVTGGLLLIKNAVHV